MSEVDKKPIQLVIGMHRSGTSVLAQTLSLLGFDLGRTLMPPSYDNPRGFWENARIVEAHDRFLNAFNLDWTVATNLPKTAFSSPAAKTAIEEISAILEDDFKSAAPSLIKDPRLCILYPLWPEVAKRLGRPLHTLNIIRAPSAVAQSMAKRNTITDVRASFIALSYLQGLVDLDLKDAPTLIYEKMVAIAAETLIADLKRVMPHMPQAALPAALSPANAVGALMYNEKKIVKDEYGIWKLYQSAIKDQALFIPHDVLKTFTEKTLHAANISELNAKFKNENTLLPESLGEVTIPRTRLDAVEGGLVERDAEIKKLWKKIGTKEKKIGALEDGISEREALLKTLRTNLEKKDTQLGAIEGGIAERENKLKTLRADITQKDTKLGALEDGISEREALLKTLRTDLEKKNTQLGAIEGGIAERENKLKTLRADITQKDTKLGALEGGITDRDKALKKARRDFKKAEKALTLGLENARLDHHKAAEREQSVYATYLNLQKEKADLDAVFETERVRAHLTEAQLQHQLDIATQHVAYFKTHPFRAALKAFIFKGFRGVRFLLPVAEDRKIAVSRKFTGLAQRFRPPAPPPIAEVNIPLPQVSADDLAIDFEFAETDAPVITVIVPVYNEIAQTLACLKTLRAQSVSVPYEVIIGDDVSPDPDHMVLSDIKGARHLRHAENLGFIENCNTCADAARGEYIVFLNNDTLLHPGWLEELYQTYFEHDNVGIVGSKLIFPTGELQEAGGLIWEDASGWNWGRGERADHPRYNYVRDVDYVSGAALMIKTSIWKEIGGFHSDLKRAYYEDTDCCFRVRAHGYRTLYQPHSTLIHIEGLTNGTDVNSGVKQSQLSNQKVFMETWKDVLKDHLPNATTPEIASDRTVKGHILYVDSVTPEPDKDSGSLDAVNAMRILTDLGYRVHFIPGTNFAHVGDPTRALQSMGVECIYHPFYSNMSQFLKERGDAFDYVVLSRAEINDLFLKQIRKACPSAKIINNTVDLHFLRQEREAKLTDDKDAKIDADKMRAKELGFMRDADATILISTHEKSLLENTTALSGKLWTIPLIRPETERLAFYDTTQDIVFIGGYGHPPNVDAVDWLVTEIWPEIRKTLPGVRLFLCGSKMPEHFKNYACDDIILKGFIPDLDRLLKKTRLTIAPLRYGAGLKGKVASSIGAGVPCVGTDIAFEGMHEDGLKTVRHAANTPAEFAQHIHTLYTDKSLWQTSSKAGVAYHNAHYGLKAVSKRYQALLLALKDF